MDNKEFELTKKLVFISLIKENQRLDLTNGLSIYSNSFYSFILRNIYKDGRKSTINYIKLLYDEAFIYIKEKKSTELITIVKQSITGLDNLIKTYSNDLYFISSIETIKKNINNINL